jgi:hypothetical protein
MPSRENTNQQQNDRPNPAVLAPASDDDETLEPDEFNTDERKQQDPDQASRIPKVAAEAEEGVEDDDADEDDDTDDEEVDEVA